MSKTHEGYLLIADITGYSVYLNDSELEHAQETLTALLELLVENTNPPLIISRLAGDAVISYGLREDFFHGQTFIEKIEDTYVTFRKALERLVLNNTCQCNACANIGNLDLKFFIHYGSFGIQRITDHDELIGSDINLIHRLLKNKVRQATGFDAYALYTDAAFKQLEIPGLESSMMKHQESYQEFPDVTVWIQDLKLVWESKKDTVEVKLPEDKVWAEFGVFLELPVEAAWDYMTQPEHRNMLIGSERMEVAGRADGRISTGSVYQCYHGDKMVPQTILEWQPFDRVIVSEFGPMFPKNPTLNEYHLEPVEGGTMMTKTITQPTGPLFGRIMLRLMMPVFRRLMVQNFAKYKQVAEQDYQAHKTKVMSSDISDGQIKEAAISSLKETN